MLLPLNMSRVGEGLVFLHYVHPCACGARIRPLSPRTAAHTHPGHRGGKGYCGHWRGWGWERTWDVSPWDRYHVQAPSHGVSRALFQPQISRPTSWTPGSPLPRVTMVPRDSGRSFRPKHWAWGEVHGGKREVQLVSKRDRRSSLLLVGRSGGPR